MHHTMPGGLLPLDPQATRRAMPSITRPFFLVAFSFGQGFLQVFPCMGLG
jgi:hypothetical protein